LLVRYGLKMPSRNEQKVPTITPSATNPSP
jgi:hypothetical protein